MKRSSARNPAAIEFARNQRRQANDFADTVWHMVRGRRCRDRKFRREYPIPPYTADFCCVELRLIIEVDGKDHETAAGRTHDVRRDEFLEALGYRVLRIPGFDTVRNFELDLKRIEQAVDARGREVGADVET